MVLARLRAAGGYVMTTSSHMPLIHPLKPSEEMRGTVIVEGWDKCVGGEGGGVIGIGIGVDGDEGADSLMMGMHLTAACKLAHHCCRG